MKSSFRVRRDKRDGMRSAVVGGKLAAVGEGASGGAIAGLGNDTADRCQGRAGRREVRVSLDQARCVRMPGMRPQGCDRSGLDEFSGVEHQRALAHLSQDSPVMGDEKHAHAALVGGERAVRERHLFDS